MPSNRAVAARAERFLAITAVAGLVVVAFAFTPGLEMFRTAKEAVFRAQALLMAFGVAAAVAFGGAERLREMLRDRAIVAILAGVLIWTAISTPLRTGSAPSFNCARSLRSVVTINLCFGSSSSMADTARDCPPEVRHREILNERCRV